MSRLIAAALSCFIGLAVVVAGDPVTTEEYVPGVISIEEANGLLTSTIAPPPPPGRGLLVGANTPVWVANLPDPLGLVNYTKLENGIIAETIEHYKYLKDSSKGKRSIDDYNFMNYDLDLQVKESSQSKRSTSTSESKVIEYSFLVVMDYTKKSWPTSEAHQRAEIKIKLVYAMAFYNALNIQLRHLENPGIRLRIAGFVIGVEKGAMPYLRRAETDTGMDRRKALRDAAGYWKVMSRMEEFHYNNWNFLGILTDSDPQPIQDIYSWDKPYWSWGLIHYGYDTTNKHVFLFNDDSAFRALPPGGSRDMRPIGDMMRNHGSWVPVSGVETHGPILEADYLPGDIIPISKQCEKRGWDESSKPCAMHEEDFPCHQLGCANHHWLSRCGSSGPALVGTACGANKDKICLDGECLAKPVGYVL